MIELTDKQRQEIGDGNSPALVVDPSTKREFFLIPADVFSRLQTALGDTDPREAYTAVDHAFAPGWNDPKMADYDNYDKHQG